MTGRSPFDPIAPGCGSPYHRAHAPEAETVQGVGRRRSRPDAGVPARDPGVAGLVRRLQGGVRFGRRRAARLPARLGVPGLEHRARGAGVLDPSDGSDGRLGHHLSELRSARSVGAVVFRFARHLRAAPRALGVHVALGGGSADPHQRPHPVPLRLDAGREGAGGASLAGAGAGLGDPACRRCPTTLGRWGRARRRRGWSSAPRASRRRRSM